ncbi:NeuD/PglB/VioB family sugar acetyltransferase [uncultured Cloacibacillus sp.]|uniref:NeuD/PglB/VioB family sugar acetyltransferase n=1 Tax=uncultured Cloacibacillus sp. TaxID=889794 RepID=UPI002582D968|nr:NeuD/PglB/VioB family sugar acetyltransferase [uncultured Cloacibacillus sp.]
MGKVKDMVIYGAGGLGREILSLLKRDYADVWSVIGFIDDSQDMPKEIDGVQLFSKDFLDGRELAVVLGFADPEGKSRVFKDLSKKKNLSFPNVISKKAVIDSNARLGKGVIITDFCWISTNASVDNAVFINVGSAIGHDAIVGDCCSIMPQCAISGNVTIGRTTLIGAKTFILQGIAIGDSAMIAAGTVVCRNVGNKEIALGNPARVLKKESGQ